MPVLFSYEMKGRLARQAGSWPRLTVESAIKWNLFLRASAAKTSFRIHELGTSMPPESF